MNKQTNVNNSNYNKNLELQVKCESNTIPNLVDLQKISDIIKLLKILHNFFLHTLTIMFKFS